MMNRRAFVTGLGAVLVSPLAAEAQQMRRVPRIGLLGPGSSRTDPGDERLFRVFRDRLEELGYAEGRNLIFPSVAAGAGGSRDRVTSRRA
jgi:putative tryptophan/tyrosine transport system substrate-binding protein